MSTLFVTLKVPIETEPLIGAAALTFFQWLPLADEDAIHIVDGEFELKLWFDIKTTWWASQPTEAEIKDHVNVLAHYINAEFKVSDIEPDVAFYIENRDFSKAPSVEEGRLQVEYEQIGDRMLDILLTRVNRLVAYARAVKGQYWLIGYQLDPDNIRSLFQRFEARGRFEESAWFRFQPRLGDHLTIEMQSESKFITQSEWQNVKSFVEGNRRPPLVGELLAGAEQLAGNGYRRSALTEAVTGLEVALYSFARNPVADSAFGEMYAERLGVPGLLQQIRHVGLSGSIRYLLPLILPEAVLPTAVIKDCQAAVAERQNVVHNGKRDVDERILRRLLQSIRQCCDTLDAITAGDSVQLEEL